LKERYLRVADIYSACYGIISLAQMVSGKLLVLNRTKVFKNRVASQVLKKLIGSF
jgi:hypothetical protein